MADFPPAGMTAKEDVEHYGFSLEDSTLRNTTDGGYQVTRPRYTRNSIRIFKTGFTWISEADRQKLLDFIDEKKLGGSAFTWIDPVSNSQFNVKLAEAPKFTYNGIANIALWNVEFTFRQV